MLGWLLAGAGIGLGCSDGGSLTVDASDAEREGMSAPMEVPAPVAGGSVVAPLVVADVAPPASGTTPDALQLTLSSNLDTVSVRSRITDLSGAPLSSCMVAEIYRVGPSAVQWPIGGSLSLPLAYDTALPDGVYVQAVTMGIGAFGNRWLQVDVPQYFTVGGGVLHAMTTEEVQAAVGSAAPGDLPVVAEDPCPPLADYSDEMTVDGATSSVDFDSWQQLGTIQPLRWVASATRPFVGALPSILTFHALLPERGRLQLDLMTPADMPADFDATFPDQGRVLLDELDADTPMSWRTLSGRASVRIDAQGRARVELADIVFARARSSERRTVASGLLVGKIVAEEWP